MNTLVAFWRDLAVAGVAGLGLGVGLVLGIFIARTTRLFMKQEKFLPYGRDDDKSDDR